MENRNDFGKGVLTGVIATILAVVLIGGAAIGGLYVTGFFGSRAKAASSQNGVKYGINDEATLNKLDLIQQYIDYYYLYDVDPEYMADSLYRGMMSGLDDTYAAYYNEEDFKQFEEDTTGIYYGIGVSVVQDDEGYITTVRVFRGSPAEEVGMESGDILYEVEGEAAYGVDLSTVVSKIRGKEGSTVNITVYRPSTDEYLTWDVERREVIRDTVVWEMLDDEIGYIMLEEFDEVSPDQFAEGLSDLYSQGMKGLILDMRDNPGGDLDSLLSIGNQILPKGKILTIDYKAEGEEVFESSGENEIQIPMVVLVNENTASAAEVLTGAIKDHRKGTIMGVQTFGKGIVQTIFYLNDGTGIKMTTADYYTPSGNNIHKVGIAPDIVVEADRDTEEDEQLDAAIEQIKKEMKSSITGQIGSILP